MVQQQTRLKVADNTGAKEIMCIRVMGGSHVRYGFVGDVIIASVKEATPSGIIEREAPIDASNVMLICPNCGRASRTGQRLIEETDHKGRQRKVRFCKACDAVVD